MLIGMSQVGSERKKEISAKMYIRKYCCKIVPGKRVSLLKGKGNNLKGKGKVKGNNLKTATHNLPSHHYILSEKQCKTRWIYQGTSWRHPLNKDLRIVLERGSHRHLPLHPWKLI